MLKSIKKIDEMPECLKNHAFKNAGWPSTVWLVYPVVSTLCKQLAPRDTFCHFFAATFHTKEDIIRAFYHDIHIVQAKSTSSKQASFRESISASENDLKSDRTWRMGFHKLCKGDLCKTGETWHYMAPFLVNSARCMHQTRLLEHFDSMLDKFSPYTHYQLRLQ